MQSVHKDYDVVLNAKNDPKTRAAVTSLLKDVFNKDVVDGELYKIDLYCPATGEFFEVECRGARWTPEDKKYPWTSNGKFKHGTVHLLFRKKKYLQESEYGYFFMRPDGKFMGYLPPQIVSKAYKGRARHNPNDLVAEGELTYDAPYHEVEWFILDESTNKWRRCLYDEY